MKTSQLKMLAYARHIAVVGLILGFGLAASGYLVSGLIMKELLAVGIGIMAASSMIFGFGLCIALMGEETENSTPGANRLL